MGKVILKTGIRNTSIPREVIKQAVLEVCQMDLSNYPDETAATIKKVALPRQRKKQGLKHGKTRRLR